MATQDETINILNSMVMAFPNASITQDNVKAYAGLLSDLAVDELMEACRRTALTCRWKFPSVAEIREEAAQIRMQASGATETALEAWGVVVTTICKSRNHAIIPEFANPITERVVQGMGWRHLCESSEHNIDRAHFLKGYMALQIGWLKDAIVITRTPVPQLEETYSAKQLEVINGEKSLAAILNK